MCPSTLTAGARNEIFITALQPHIIDFRPAFRHCVSFRTMDRRCPSWVIGKIEWVEVVYVANGESGHEDGKTAEREIAK